MKIKLDDRAFMPERAHDTDAGLDLKSPGDYLILPHKAGVIDTGVHVEIPKGCCGMLKSKSGLNIKHGIVSEGVVDCGYTGSIVVKLYNHSNKTYKVSRGDKISQLVVVPIKIEKLQVVDELEMTERGDNGFGSSGR